MKKTCKICIHNQLCWARVEVTRTIQGFKMFSIDIREQKNMNTTGTTDDVFTALAGCCSRYTEENKNV